jgi:hypothetical protein
MNDVPTTSLHTPVKETQHPPTKVDPKVSCLQYVPWAERTMTYLVAAFKAHGGMAENRYQSPAVSVVKSADEKFTVIKGEPVGKPPASAK